MSNNGDNINKNKKYKKKIEKPNKQTNQKIITVGFLLG